MSTIFKNILPIPESVVVGSGSYVIPANKYGFLMASVSHSSVGWIGPNAMYNSTSTQGVSSASTTGSGSANSGHQWVKAGDSITVGVSAVTIQSGQNMSTQASYADGYAYVYLNGSIFCSSRSAAASAYFTGGSSQYSGVRQNGTATWSVSLFPIPKNNLPSELIEGN